MSARSRPGAVATAISDPRVVAAAMGILVTVLAARAATLPADDPDIWWIAAAGRDFWATGTAPTYNAYSFTAPGQPWLMHELAFGMLLAPLLEAFGPAIFPLSTLGFGAASIAVATLFVLDEARHLAAAATALAVLLAGTTGALFAPRPSHASLVLPLAMTALALRPGWDAARTACAVALEILWTNTHGSFPLGVVILAAGAFAEPALEAGEGAVRLRAAALAAAATLLNPYGVNLYGLVGRYAIGGDETARIIHEHIVEFFPLWRGREPFLNARNAVALALLTLIAARSLRRRRHVARALFALAVAGLAVYQVRHVTLAVVLGAVWLHAEIDDLCAEGGWPAPRIRVRRLAAAIVLPGLTIALALWIHAFRAHPTDRWIAADIGGGALARLSARLPDGARVFAPFPSGGLLIWLGARRGASVFFDSRNDCYPPDVAEAAFFLERGGSPADVAATLDRYRTDAAIVPAGHPVFDALVRSPDWRPTVHDEGWMLFRRAGRGDASP